MAGAGPSRAARPLKSDPVLHRLPIALIAAGLLSGPAGTAAEEAVEGAGAPAVRALIDAGKYREAEEAGRSLLRDLEAQAPGDPKAVAVALDLLVESLHRGGKSKQPETLDLAKRAVALKEQSFGAEHPALAVSFQNLATVLRLRGEPEGAQRLLERALAIKEKEGGPDHPDLVGILSALGNVLREYPDYDGATAYYLRAIAISEAAYGPDARQVAVVLTNLAANHEERGAFRESLPIHERAVAIMRAVHAGAPHPELAHALNGLANTLRDLGEYERARALHEEALAIRETALGPDHQSVGASLNNLALVMQAQGDLQGARVALERAVAIWEKGLGPDHPMVAQGYNNLGTLAGRLGNFDRARQHLDAALAIRLKRLGPDHPLVAQTELNLGKLLVILRDYPAAKPHLEAAIANWEKSLGADNPQVALARLSLGRLLLETGDRDAARQELESTLEIAERGLGPDHPLVGETLAALGELDREAGDLDGARERQSRALAIQEASLGSGSPDVSEARMRLAATDFDLGRLGEARAEAGAGATSNQRFLRDTLGVLSEHESLLLIARQERPEVTLFSGLLTDEANRQSWLSACWAWTLGQRGLVLEEMAARRRAAHLGASGEIRAAWDRLTAARRLLAATWVRGVEEEKTATYRESLERATREKEAAEIEMARVSARYREERRSSQATIEDLIAALPPESALVEVARVPIRSRGARDEILHDIALILLPGGRFDGADLGLSVDIDRLASSWRDSLDATAAGAQAEDATARSTQAGWRLRRATWEPIAARTERIGTLFLVPGGALLTINPSALPAEDGTFLLENGPRIHLIGAARDLLRPSRAPEGRDGSQARGVLLVGAPDFQAPLAARMAALDPQGKADVYRGSRGACASPTVTSWSPLPDAAREIAQIGALFKKSVPMTTLSGAAASEERFKAEAPGKRVLHLATHGYFLEERCAPGWRENPLLLSGLVLAGANAPGTGARDEATDDGVLTAEEVAALDLSGTGLAVLSACDTGRGAVQAGEGVFGLRRSLEMAGVQAIVMSLWPAPDREARRWMTSFYETLLKGATVADASRQASLRSLERLRAATRYPHPYSWGGFVATGDWRAAVPTRPQGQGARSQ